MQVGGDTLGYDSLSAALADLPSDNNVITLLKNIDLGAQVSVPANSGAATITAAGNEDGTPIEITWENATASFFTVTAVYDNGESEEVSDYSISPNTALTASGTVAVKITYQGVQKDVSINVEPQKQTVNVVIYRNGDFTTPYKTVALDKVPKGNAIDLSKLNITNYYTANVSSTAGIMTAHGTNIRKIPRIRLPA